MKRSSGLAILASVLAAGLGRVRCLWACPRLPGAGFSGRLAVTSCRVRKPALVAAGRGRGPGATSRAHAHAGQRYAAEVLSIDRIGAGASG